MVSSISAPGILALFSCLISFRAHTGCQSFSTSNSGSSRDPTRNHPAKLLLSCLSACPVSASHYLEKKKKNVLFTILLTFFATTVMAVAVVCFERIDSSSFRLLTIITKLTQYFFFLFFAGLHAVVLPTARLRPRCPRRCSLRINRESPCRSSDAIYGPFLFIYIYLPLNDLIFNVRDLERILNHVLSYSLAVSHELNRLSHSQFTRCVNKTC